MPRSGVRVSDGRSELVVIAVIPSVSAVARAPPAPVPNAAITAPMIQAATITYSNDTTPSLSVLRRFTRSNVILQHMRNFLLLDVRLRWLRTSQPLIGKTCYQLGSNIFQIYSSHNIFGCRFMSVVLVYDVKISQLGRKNLAVRFNLINLIHTKLAAAPKTPSPVARRSARTCEGRGIDIRHGAPRKFEHAFKID